MKQRRSLTSWCDKRCGYRQTKATENKPSPIQQQIHPIPVSRNDMRTRKSISNWLNHSNFPVPHVNRTTGKIYNTMFLFCNPTFPSEKQLSFVSRHGKVASSLIQPLGLGSDACRWNSLIPFDLDHHESPPKNVLLICTSYRRLNASYSWEIVAVAGQKRVPPATTLNVNLNFEFFIERFRTLVVTNSVKRHSGVPTINTFPPYRGLWAHLTGTVTYAPTFYSTISTNTSILWDI